MAKPECTVCGRVDIGSTLLHECRYCGFKHCSKHLLPENHDCIGLAPEGMDVWIADREKFRDLDAPRERDSSGSTPIGPGTVGTRKRAPRSSSPSVSTNSRPANGSGNLTGSLLKLIVVVALVVGGVLVASGQMNLGEMGQTEKPEPGEAAIPNTTASPTPTRVPVAQVSTETASVTSTPTPELKPAIVEELIHEEINRRRKIFGEPTIDLDPDLQEIARGHSAVMARHGTIFHTQPEGDDLQDRYDQAGYDCRVETGSGTYSLGGENVAQTWYDQDVMSDRGVVHYDTPDELAKGVVNQWMNSSGHRQNILKSYWENEGIGVNLTRVDGDIAVYVTQDFC